MPARPSLIAVLAFLCVLAVIPANSAERLIVFAPASMREAMTRITDAYHEIAADRVVTSFAASSQLARQLDRGAPADIVVTADVEWMDWLRQRGRILPESRNNIAANRLVIAVRREVENWADPLKMLETGRFAMSEPQGVPSGRYAKQALTGMGIWDKASKRAVFAENVRVALALVARGDVEAAIVYQSDLEIEPRVRGLLVFDAKLHAPIVYAAAITSEAKSESAAFMKFLAGKRAQNILTSLGFAQP